jgi:phage gp46-like protein
MEKIDIALKKNKNGIYDISIENGDLLGVDSFNTALQISLFSDQRADASEQPVNYLRRGFWGDILNDVVGFEIGSKLWQLSQTRATQLVANKAETIVREALAWLIEDGHLSNVLVTSELESDNITINIVLVRYNNIVESKSFKLWENTGAGNEF